MSLFVILFLSAFANAAPTVVRVSQDFRSCIQEVRQSSLEDKSYVFMPYTNDPHLKFSRKDVEYLNCFNELAEREKFSYPRCFDVAATLPTSHARSVASQECFNAWHLEGSLGNCYWGARQVERFSKYEQSVTFDSSGGIHYFGRLGAQAVGSLSVPRAIEPLFYLRERCLANNQRVFEPRRLQELERKRQDAVKAEIERKLRPRKPTIARVIASRPLSDAEKRVCELEAPVIASQYETYRSNRARVAQPLLGHLRKALEGVPLRVRSGVHIDREREVQQDWQSYRLSEELWAFMYLRSEAPFTLVYHYVDSQSGEEFKGQIHVHYTFEEDWAEVEAQINPPAEKGWKAFQQQNALDGCPLLPFLNPASVAQGDDRKGPSDQEAEKRPETAGTAN